MPKFFCDYCDVYLTHDSMSVRKAHNSGRNHLRNVVDYYQQLSQERAQSVIDAVTNSYAAEGQANPMTQMQQPRGFGGPGGMPFPFPPNGMPPFPMPGGPGGRGAPSFPPPGGLPFPPPNMAGLPNAPFNPPQGMPPLPFPFPPIPGGPPTAAGLPPHVPMGAGLTPPQRLPFPPPSFPMMPGGGVPTPPTGGYGVPPEGRPPGA